MGVKRKIKKAAEADVVTIREAFDEFIEEKIAKNLSQTTITNYESSLSYFLTFHEYTDDTPTIAITLSDIYEWQNSLKLDGVSISSINHYLRDCRTFFYWCMNTDRKYIEPGFKIEMVKGQEESLKIFTDEEMDLLLEKPKNRDSFVDWRTWAIISWVLATGNRASTICEVRIGDVDYKNKEIELRHTKNKKAQNIPLSSSLEIVLKEYCKMWRRGAPATAWLFPNIGEDQLTTNALRQAFGKYCESRGVDKSNIHGLRHSFARAWIKNNGSTFQLQKILGHSTLEMTRKYVRLFSEDLKQDFDKFNPLDNIKRSAKRTKNVSRS